MPNCSLTSGLIALVNRPRHRRASARRILGSGPTSVVWSKSALEAAETGLGIQNGARQVVVLNLSEYFKRVRISLAGMRESWCWCGSWVPRHVRPRQEDRSLRIPLPRRERPRGRPPCTARHQGAWPARRGRTPSGLIDGLIASAARHSRRSIVLSSFYRGDLPELHRASALDPI